MYSSRDIQISILRGVYEPCTGPLNCRLKLCLRL